LYSLHSPKTLTNLFVSRPHRENTTLVAMAASLQAAATFMQPTKLGRTNTLQPKAPQSLSKAFGLEPAGAKLSCSLQTDLKDFAQKCVDATKIAGFALATSALVVSVCTLLFYQFHDINLLLTVT